jgi:uncharacterized protein YecE (DUF72 family)
MIAWKIGCSGYHYDEWKGLFYPEGVAKNKWFEFYIEHFNTIELNTTFYRFPRVEFLRTWYKRSSEHFSFSVKAPRLITHFKKFKDAQKYLGDFYTTVRNGLNDKLGCVLFQFPATFQFQEEYLERISKLLDPAFNNVLEFRHTSWWSDQVRQVLADHHISFSGMSHPSLPADVLKTTDTVYYRFHGTPHLYTSRYELPSLEEAVHKIHQLEGVQEAFIYFNNTAEGAAVTTAREFQEICELVH